MEKENLIKKVCKEHNLTYKELADELGYSESAIANAVSLDKISPTMEKSIELFLRIKAMEKEYKDYIRLKESLINILSLKK